ncbi:MAG: hypothetical protein NVS2B3_01520 [Vulcanimicrobiaceae bacterium]
MATARLGADFGLTRPRTLSLVRWSGEWIYFSAVLASWCFIPLLRRFLDWKSGSFSTQPILSLLPYLALLPLVWLCLQPSRMRKINRRFKFFALIWSITFGYGLAVGFANGNGSAASFAFMQYMFPMVLGFWFAGQPIDISIALRRATMLACVYGTIVAAYGVAQYISPAPWDVFWVVAANWTSSGPPLPYSLRIFSTLNSTGPCADFLALAIVLSLRFFRLRSVWILPVSAVLGAALMLTLVRATWIGLVAGVLVYILLSPRRLNAIPIIAIFGVLLAVSVFALPAYLGADNKAAAIVDRMSTFGDINGDASAVARQNEIGQSFAHSLTNPVGEGLGTLGAGARLSSNSDLLGENLDSGYLSRLLELGWLGFGGYCFVVFGGMISIVGAPRALGRRLDPEFCTVAATAAAVAATLIWLDAAGDSHYGIDGLFFWVAMSAFAGHKTLGAPHTAAVARAR